MPVLGNPRHERAAQVIAGGGSAELAAAAAGFDTEASSFGPNARRLIQRPDIKERVRELQAEVAVKLIDVTAEWIQQRVAKIAAAEIPQDEIKASDVIAAARLLAQMIPGAMAPTKIAPTDPEGEGPARLEISWLPPGSQSTTLPDYSLQHSTSGESDTPALSPTDAPEKLLPASMTFNGGPSKAD